ncbi:hypothetical protein TorRG33x02_275090 [Trema orientale]|uniref:Uncharacterized protein n=1 Tax=Trema orientale TaxID=63057 RepID=A0A2P5CRW9_TREOI|nr:hypothetical protein TorRG33x02_275090 [Trema orientale]
MPGVCIIFRKWSIWTNTKILVIIAVAKIELPISTFISRVNFLGSASTLRLLYPVILVTIAPKYRELTFNFLEP